MASYVDFWCEIQQLDSRLQDPPKYRYWPFCNPNLVTHSLELCRSSIAKFKDHFPWEWLELVSRAGRLGDMIVRQNLTTGQITIFELYTSKDAERFRNYVKKYNKYPNIPQL